MFGKAGMGSTEKPGEVRGKRGWEARKNPEKFVENAVRNRGAPKNR
jgi:hypothetical protein